MKQIFYKILAISVLTFFCAHAQYYSPIQNISSELYNGGNQNWGLSQDSQDRIYAANNFGLLEFNGINWKLYPTPNNTIMRSVLVNSGTIYSGAYMDFGMWLRQTNGQLNYVSLTESLDFDMIEDEQIWSIFSHKQYIVFQSLDRLIIYDQLKRELKAFNPVSGILKSFVENDGIYYQDNNLNLYKIENEQNQLFLSASQLKGLQVVGISQSNSETLIVTRNGGLLSSKANVVVTSFKQVNNDLSRDVVYCFDKDQNGQLILGTVKNGVYILAPNGDLVQHYSQEQGLQNKTVLSVFVDKTNNLWLGLDEGMAHISLGAPIHLHQANQSLVGTVYSTLVFEDYLYVGTNQGLYFKRNNTNDALQPVPGLEGQVWSLSIVDKTLFCGHSIGAFSVVKEKATPLYVKSGFWLFKPLSETKMIAGAYNGLHLFVKQNNQWIYSNHIKNFTISSRYFELLDDKQALVSHEYKGVYKLNFDNNLTSAMSVENVQDAPNSLYASMVKFLDELCYFSKQGFFVFDNTLNKFKRNDIISDLFDEKNFTSAKMVVDRNRYLWLFARNNLIRIEKAALSDEYQFSKFPLPYDIRKTNTGFENISYVQKDKYLIGASNGFLLFDTSKAQRTSPTLQVERVIASSLNGKRLQLDLTAPIELAAQYNSITTDLFLTHYDLLGEPLFQYKLEGYSENWSPWAPDPSISFGNLRFGSYTLMVRVKIGDAVVEKPLELPFKIKRPWYFSTVALICYALLMFGFYQLVNIRYSSYYRKEQEKLIKENKRKLDLMELKKNEEIMRIKNEQLEENIDQKNKELAISTMAMIKKNQFMNALLHDLEPAATQPTVSRVIRTIKRSLKNDDDWEFFEQAFNNADKDFLDQLKQLHPKLTNHDLKLCAYLRLNLSSKEIAPLLNISVKSVDIKRYRLRKKMDLDHNQNLTEYILSL